MKLFFEKKKKEKNIKFIVHGYHPVQSIINSPFFEINKIVFSEEKKQVNNSIINRIKDRIDSEFISSQKFGNYCSEKNNHGVFAIINSYNYISWKDMLAIKPSKRNFKLIVCLDGIEDPSNFGSIIRSCAAFWVDCILICDKGQVPVNGTVVKVSAGAAAYIPVCKVSNLFDSLEQLKALNYNIITTNCKNVKFNGYDDLGLIKNNSCVVFGNENFGVKSKIINISDAEVFIPLDSRVKSLNVSVSCGIIISKIPINM